MEIKVNREIRNYNEAIFLGLSIRQLIFSALAVAVAGNVPGWGRNLPLPAIFFSGQAPFGSRAHRMSQSEVTIMCFNNGNNNCSCLWLIIIVVLICCCCGSGNALGGNSCGCGCGCGGGNDGCNNGCC